MTTDRVTVNVDYNNVALLLPAYDGNKKTLNFYIKCVENVLERIENRDDSCIASLILNKLTGKAVEALSENSNFQSWSDIKNILIQRFGDPRGEIELTQDLIKLNRNRDSIEIFSEKIRELTYSLINHGTQKTLYYEKMAISVLLEQIHPMISIMVRTQNPKSLEDVISLVKQEEVKYLKYRNREREHTKPMFTPSYNNTPKPNFGVQSAQRSYQPNTQIKQQNYGKPKIKPEKVNFQIEDNTLESQQYPESDSENPHCSDSNFQDILDENTDI